LFWNQILDLKNGTAQPNVNANKMTTIIFPSCPKEIQEEIVEYKKDKSLKNSVLKQAQFYFHKINIVHQNLKLIISENEKQSEIIYKLKQAILQEAIAGQLTAEWRTQNPMQKGNPDTDAAALLAKIKAEKQQLIAEGKLKKEKPLPKIAIDEIPFSLPDSWVWSRLGEICTKIGSGSTPRGSDYSEIGIPFFRSQNIHNNGLVFKDIKYISSEMHKKMNGTAILSGDLLLNITGGSLGRCALLPENINDGNVSQHVCIIRPLLSNNTFFHFLILSPLFQTLVFKQTTGAGREGLPKYNMERFLIPLPPLGEQKAIAEKVDRLMKTIDQLEQQIKHRKQLAEDLMQTVLREAFE
jgi:type I restriction enzyme S subunit